MNDPVRSYRRGRLPCLDEKKKSDICAVIAMGCPLKTAADFVGCARRTVYLQAAKDPQFAAEILKARSRGEIRNLDLIREVANAKNWKAAAWLLTHCHQRTYAIRRGEGIKPEQLQAVLGRFADALLGEVSNAEDRQRIAAKLNEIDRELASTVEVTKQLGQEA